MTAARPQIARILVPVDFSPCSEHALRWAFELAAKAGAQIDVLHVWQPSPYVAPTSLVYLNGQQQSFWDHMRTELAKRLDDMVVRCRGAFADVASETFIEAGYPSSNILTAVEQRGHDLVVMGTHGRKWLAHVLLGSVAARVVRLAPCPVITLRLPEMGRQEENDEAGGSKPPGRGFETPTHI